MTLMFFNSRRPKDWLQHCTSEAERLAVQTFTLNRGKSGEAFALERLRLALKGG